MQPRLQRYKQFIEEQYVPSLTWNKDYSLEHLSEELRAKISAGKFRNLFFTGMGCSAIVSDTIKGLFASEKIPVHVEVINDYDIDFLVDVEGLKTGDTLAIISSYSGYSQEAIRSFYRLKEHTDNIILLTSGGRLGEIAAEENVSLVHWKLRNPDREYPLFHVPQYFGILLDIFYTLGFLSSNYQVELEAASQKLVHLAETQTEKAASVANRLKDRDIVFLASPRWYLTLLKLADMHVNEMAMAPAHRNFLHEYTHSEVAILSDPKSRQAVVVFEDDADDEYTKGKISNLGRLLSEPVPQNRKIEFVAIPVEGENFVEKFFSTLLFVQLVALSLGEYYDVPSRELISRAAGNPWYNQKTIQAEQGE